MNATTKIPTSACFLALALAAVAGCGQPYTPEPKAHDAGPQNPGGIFDTTPQQANYDMLTYEVLRSTLRDVLAIGVDPAADAAVVCVGDGVTIETSCPKANPLGYLDANADQLGAAVYENENPAETYGPKLLSSGGFKVWMLAASSACGRMVSEQSQPVLFPNDFPGSDLFIDDYDHAFLTLLGRLPREAEVARLDAAQNAVDAGNVPFFNTLPERGAAVCTVLLGNLEFLGAN